MFYNRPKAVFCILRVSKRTILGALLAVEMSKVMLLLREARVQVKCKKHARVGELLEVEISKECTPFWHETHFHLKSVKN